MREEGPAGGSLSADCGGEDLRLPIALAAGTKLGFFLVLLRLERFQLFFVDLEIASFAKGSDADVVLHATGAASLSHQAIMRLVAPIPVVLEMGAEHDWY